MTTITRVVRSAYNYPLPATNALDGNSATQADIQYDTSETTLDFFRIDLGSSDVITSIDFQNVVSSGSDTFVEVYGSNNAAAVPGDANTTSFNGNFSGPTTLFAAAAYSAPSTTKTNVPGSAGASFRYVLVPARSSAGTAGVFKVGEIIVNVAWAASAPANPIATFAAGAVGVSATPRPVGENVTSYKCYRDQNGGGFAVIDTKPAPSFSDPAPQITTAYTRAYYITAVNAQGESPASATVTANIPAQVLTSNSQHLFSSGTLVANWLDSQSNPQTATFATLQDIGSDLSFDRKDLWDTVINSIFPIDSADSMGKLTFKIGNATISADTLQRIVAGQLATAGGVTTLTLPKSVKLPVFSAVLTLTDTKGKTITVNLNLVKAKGVTLPFKINDFVIEAFEIDCYPDANGVIGTWVFNS